MADVRLKIGAYIEDLKKGINQAKGHIARFTNFVKTHNAQIKNLRMKAGLALAGEILAIRNVTNEYLEAQKADAAVRQSLQSTHGVVGLTKKQLDEMANAMMRNVAVDDDVIKRGQALMLTFTRIGKNTFPEAMTTALDMTAALHQGDITAEGLQQTIIQLGKALQDPILGATALRRVGVNLDDQMKKQLETLVNLGKHEEAQKLILKELQIEFGGQAKAAADATGGLRALNVSWGELRETLGAAIFPLLKKLALWFVDVLPKIQKFIEENRKLVAVLVGGGIGGTGLVFALSQFALLFANPATGWIAGIGFAALAIASLVAWMDKLIDATREVPDSLEGLNKAIAEADAKLERYRGELEMLKETEPVAGEDIARDIETLNNAITRQLLYIIELKTARAKLIGARRTEALPPLLPIEQLDEASIQAQLETLKSFIDRVQSERDKLVERAKPIQLLPEIERTPEQIAQLDELIKQINEKTILIQEATDALEKAMQIKVPEFEGETYQEALDRFLGVTVATTPLEEIYGREKAADEEFKEYLEESQKERLEKEGEYWDLLLDMHKQKREQDEDEQKEYLDALKQMTYEGMKAHVDIWERAFSNVFDITRSGMHNIGLAMLEGMVGMINMKADAALKEFLIKKLEVASEISLRALLNPVELAKLAFIGAITGAFKSGLSAIVSAARGDMQASLPRYQYGGVVPETGLALVHEGERIFNPTYPIESLRNVGGTITFEQNIYGNVRRGDLDKANEDFVDYLFARRLARGLS